MELDNIPVEGLSDGSFFQTLRDASIAEIKALIYRAEDLLERQDLLVRLPREETFVVGDMHGDISVCFGVVTAFLRSNEAARCVFLGDYVDRGPHQVDVVNLVLLLKITSPDRVHLLRGNHETAMINEENGFKHNLSRQFGNEDGRILWHLYNRLFTHFPLAATTPDGVFLVHGGIPEGLESIDSINQLPREFNPEHQQVIELLWNDPVESRKVGGFKKNERGGTVKKFGGDALDSFLSTNGLTAVVRAHEEHIEGFKYFFDEKLLSLFSARRELDNPFARQVKPKLLRIQVDGRWSIEDVVHDNLST